MLRYGGSPVFGVSTWRFISYLKFGIRFRIWDSFWLITTYSLWVGRGVFDLAMRMDFTFHFPVHLFGGRFWVLFPLSAVFLFSLCSGFALFLKGSCFFIFVVSMDFTLAFQSSCCIIKLLEVNSF